MTNNYIILLRYIFKIILCISIIASGIFLIIGCISIYTSGDGYSRKIVADTFAKICIPIYICIALIIIDVIWEIFSPTSKGNKKINKKSESEPVANETGKTRILQLCVLSFAVALLIVGIIWGGYSDVLTKAVNICTECIGLG